MIALQFLSFGMALEWLRSEWPDIAVTLDAIANEENQ